MTDGDAAGEDGLPALCAAVAAHDFAAAEALVGAGADPDRVLPDGTTPLLRAVEGGSPAVVRALLRDDARLRLPEAERARLLRAARRWYEEGAQARLRRLTGEAGPAHTAWPEEQWCQVEQITLGALTARAGHGAVLTALESAFGVPAPPAELG
ncbi:ankyrin repeat domain-containing protein [Streptomyces vinaceus]